MKEDQPFMLMRCLPGDRAGNEFLRWFHTIHLRDVAGIPGIERVFSAKAGDGALLGIYVFENVRAVQSAMQSPQAAYARGAWNRWMPLVEELRVEIFAPLMPMPIFKSAN